MRHRPTLPLALVLIALLTASCSFGGEGSARGKDRRPSATPSPTATPVAGGLGPEFFGMHDADPVGGSWPDAPVGSLRVWDSGAVWNQIETAPGSYDFGRLDAIVETAREHKAQVLIVLGQTPVFHATRPKKVGSYGPGASSMPDIEAWKAYVRAVVTRYTGADIAFQVWNEANVEGYWTGSPRQMAELTLAAREVLNEVGSTQTLVGPAMATRLLFHRAFFRDFYRQQVAGRPVADLVDVLSFQLYPMADEPPEAALKLLAATRELLSVEGVDPAKPIWNTEINYGLQGGLPAEPTSEEQQQANVARTYLLNAANGVQRVYWYSWDLHTIADTELVAADNVTATSAGQAFATVRKWIEGAKVESCNRVEGGTWVCDLTTPFGAQQVYWSTRGDATVRTPFTARWAEPLGEVAQQVPLGGTTISIGGRPVLLSGDRPGVPALPPLV